jgi:hypothetical protein
MISNLCQLRTQENGHAGSIEQNASDGKCHMHHTKELIITTKTQSAPLLYCRDIGMRVGRFGGEACSYAPMCPLAVGAASWTCVDQKRVRRDIAGRRVDDWRELHSGVTSSQDGQDGE